MKCRFLYLIGELHTGGAERQLYYLLRAMDRERYKPAVAVWNYCDRDIHVSKVRALGIPFYPFTRESSSTAKLSAFRRLVRDLQPELVHSYSFYTNFAAEWAARGTGSLPIGSIRSDFVWAVKQCGPILGRLSSRWPSTQICNSVAAAESTRSLKGIFTPARALVVRNAIDLQRFRSCSVPTSQGVRILGIGYLLPVKRWERLLAAVQTLKARGLDFFVQIAGDGPLRLALEIQARDLGVFDRVEFLGHVDDIPRLLSEAAFVVHTADSEGCPNSVMEAMACGRTVVAIEAGDIPILIEHGKTGFLVSHDRQDKLVEYMEKLLLEPQLCQLMGQSAREAAEQKFDLDRLVSNTLEAYRSAGWSDA
jgi:glycosyltransferase involved in cell wall biosynthesis